MAEVETKEKWNNEQISYENNYRSPLSSNTVSTQHKKPCPDYQSR